MLFLFFRIRDDPCLKMIKYLVLVALTLACSINCNEAANCSHKEVSSSFLDIAVDMITKSNDSIPACSDTSVCNQKEIAQSYLHMAVHMIRKADDNTPTCPTNEKIKNSRAVDCADLLFTGHSTSGVYEIWPMNRAFENPLRVYCDMETSGGGWTVIQRRGDFKRPEDYFYKDWKSYKEGFGDVEIDFWLGNDNIFALSNQKHYSIRFDLADVEGTKKYALYDEFWIENEMAKYQLHISDFSGDAGDSMTYHNNQKFSTKDQDNDGSAINCAQKYKGAWWYNTCYLASLNGLYIKGRGDGSNERIHWETWKGDKESLEWTEMKIRPKNFTHTLK